MKKRLLAVGFGIFLIVLWYVIARIIDTTFILPTPFEVLAAIRNNFREIMTVHFVATMRVVLIGSLISLVLGLGFATAMIINSSLEKAIYPILTISQTIPSMCLTPILVMWFGYTVTTRVIVVVLMTFFSITVNVFDGFNAVRVETRELLSTYGANRKQIFWTLQVPTALPYFFTALKVSIPWAVVAASVSEWFGAQAGLGHFSKERMLSLDVPGLLAPLVVVSITALAITELIKFIERKVVTWENDI
ncbi:MAG: ABC transporter permease [Erysipelotrichaceae bacterium]|nr:ABC transporter permease [Erysipelotrichaceae bacterium]